MAPGGSALERCQPHRECGACSGRLQHQAGRRSSAQALETRWELRALPKGAPWRIAALQICTERLREWMAGHVLKPLVAAVDGAHRCFFFLFFLFFFVFFLSLFFWGGEPGASGPHGLA